jgi:hypothetical protein
LLSRGRLLRASLLCAAAMVAAAPASAWMRGNPKLAQISIVERATGRVLPQYSHEGELWVVGRPGANYAVRIRNLESRRIMGVISVDGVNAINGRTASSAPKAAMCWMRATAMTCGAGARAMTTWLRSISPKAICPMPPEPAGRRMWA